MLSISRLPVLVFLTLVIFGGPVAASICTEEASMATMPCCPDQSPCPDQGDPGFPPAIAAACATAPSAGLSAPISELPTPTAVLSLVLADWHGLDPPRATSPASMHARHRGSPIYLTTQRLRI